jgi:hypothetical protein
MILGISDAQHNNALPFSECQILSIIMLSVVMLSVVAPSAIMLSVVMLNVVAPKNAVSA